MPIASIIGGLISQGGAQQGGDMAWGAANQSAQMQTQEAKRSRAALSPWSGAGTSAVGQITKLLGLGTLTQQGNNDGIYWVDPTGAKEAQQNAFADFQTDPGYGFRKQEGINALDRSATARGLRLSGSQIKAVQGFGDGLASEEYGNYFNRLAALSGQGQTATTSGNNTSAALTAGAGNALTTGGVARGSAYASGANALATGLSKGMQNAFSLASYGGSGGKLGLPGWA